MKLNALPLLICMALATVGIAPQSLALTPTEPLALASDFLPSISFSETHTDSVRKTVNPVDHTVAYDVVASRSTTATIIANLKGIDPLTINGTTPFSLTFGATQISFLLSEIPTFTAGQTTAFYCWNGWDATKKPKGTGGVKLTWTATKLTAVVTMGNEALRPLPIGTDAFVGAGSTPGTFPIKDTLTAEIGFGPIRSHVARAVYVTGTYKITHVATTAYAFDLSTVTETGSGDYTRPSVALVSPKQSASVGDSVDISGTALDAKGLASVEWATDINGAWTATDQFSLSAFPADGLWGSTSANWTVSLAGLRHGVNRVWVRSVDDSGNTSAPLLVTLIYPMPTVLAGRWDGLLTPDATNPMRGAITFTFAANGTCTGSLATEAGTFPFSGTLQPDETLAASIKRGTLTSISLTGAIANFTPAGETTAAITATLKIGAASVATVSAFRSPWSTTKLADPSLAGRFHVKIDPATVPTGNSYAIVTTARSGAASAAFTMADGSAATWSGVMGASGQLPAFALGYGGKGSVSGPLTVNGTTRTIDATTITWMRPVAYADKQFPAGFLYPALAASGIAYVAPTPLSTPVMGLGTASLNASASWIGDDVTARSLAFTVKTGNTTAITSPVDALNLAVTATTGLWTGGFKIPGTAVLSSCKLLIVGDEAYGHWTAPAPTGSAIKRFGLIHIQ